jgi:glutathione S-transferase
VKIYGIVTSPFVRMCLVTAHECGIAGKLQHIPERPSITEANTTLTSLSALGKVPILETDHHHTIYDSRVIIEYLAHIAGNKTLIPDEGVKRFRILTLQALGQGLSDAAVAYRYEVAERPSELKWAKWLSRATLRMNAAMDDLDRNWNSDLADVTAGSIAAAVALSYIEFRIPELNWRNGRAKLAAFHEKFSKRESMVRTALAAA